MLCSVHAHGHNAIGTLVGDSESSSTWSSSDSDTGEEEKDTQTGHKKGLKRTYTALHDLAADGELNIIPPVLYSITFRLERNVWYACYVENSIVTS